MWPFVSSAFFSVLAGVINNPFVGFTWSDLCLGGNYSKSSRWSRENPGCYPNTSSGCFRERLQRATREEHLGECVKTFATVVLLKGVSSFSYHIEGYNPCNPCLGQDVYTQINQGFFGPITRVSKWQQNQHKMFCLIKISDLNETRTVAREAAFLCSGKANTDLMCRGSHIPPKTNSSKG